MSSAEGAEEGPHQLETIVTPVQLWVAEGAEIHFHRPPDQWHHLAVM